MNKREMLKRIIENWFVEKTSIRPTKDGLNSLVDRIHYNKQLTLTDVVKSDSEQLDADFISIVGKEAHFYKDGKIFKKEKLKFSD